MHERDGITYVDGFEANVTTNIYRPTILDIKWKFPDCSGCEHIRVHKKDAKKRRRKGTLFALTRKKTQNGGGFE